MCDMYRGGAHDYYALGHFTIYFPNWKIRRNTFPAPEGQPAQHSHVRIQDECFSLVVTAEEISIPLQSYDQSGLTFTMICDSHMFHTSVPFQCTLFLILDRFG